MSEEESVRIMQEILSMKIGMNTEGNVDDNDEAEQMIRAITHGDIDHSVYSKMADDLENAAQVKRKQIKAAAAAKKKVTCTLSHTTC